MTAVLYIIASVDLLNRHSADEVTEAALSSRCLGEDNLKF